MTKLLILKIGENFEPLSRTTHTNFLGFTNVCINTKSLSIIAQKKILFIRKGKNKYQCVFAKSSSMKALNKRKININDK